MTFLLCKYDYSINRQIIFGFIEAESPKEAAADPCVNLKIVGTMGGGTQHVLQRLKEDVTTQWYLEEINPLEKRPSELD